MFDQIITIKSDYLGNLMSDPFDTSKVDQLGILSDPFGTINPDQLDTLKSDPFGTIKSDQLGTIKPNQLDTLKKFCLARLGPTSSAPLTDEEGSAGARRPAGELNNDDVSSNVSNQQKATAQTSSWYWKLAIAKRCRLNKSIRQCFAFTLKIQQMTCAMIKNQQIATGISNQLLQESSSSDANSAATQKFSSDAGVIFSMKISEFLDAKQDCCTESFMPQQGCFGFLYYVQRKVEFLVVGCVLQPEPVGAACFSFSENLCPYFGCDETKCDPGLEDSLELGTWIKVENVNVLAQVMLLARFTFALLSPSPHIYC
ncbi:hypothetical protein F511_41951 [Dorcoceras hygrometricum]|uniref:Uncharacterized protein n=1 Tax=Dorcoceras hygrometricum TaxID=472368 RepID=A0A2Z7ACL6_9LAMI|nr:hypothetical protein F511_41951 [Dorcoceras hygrometricum]